MYGGHYFAVPAILLVSCSTMYARRPAASNLGFFSKSFSVNSTSTPQTTQTTTNVVVKTRLVPKSTNTGAVKVVARDATPAAASSSSRAPSATPSETSKKRKPVADPFSEILRVKKPRLSRSPAQSRAASARPSEEPSTRASSVAPSRQDSPLTRRQAPWIDEDGQPGSEMLSCEITVRNIMKGYKACMYTVFRPCTRHHLNTSSLQESFRCSRHLIRAAYYQLSSN